MAQDRGVDALISAFVCYSELSAVKYESDKDILKLEVLLNAKLPDQQLSEFITKVKQCLKLYFNLTDTSPELAEIDYSRSGDITLLNIWRDAHSLGKDEIELLITLLRDHFDDILIRDYNSKISQASCERQIKRSMLQLEKKNASSATTLFAYRDEGTMFVFNK